MEANKETQMPTTPEYEAAPVTQAAEESPTGVDNHSMQVRVGLFVGVLLVGALLAWLLFSVLMQNNSSVTGETSVDTTTESETEAELTYEERVEILDQAVAEAEAEFGDLSTDLSHEERQELLDEAMMEAKVEGEATADGEMDIDTYAE